MEGAYLRRLFGELQTKGVLIEQGLNEEETSRIEGTYGFRFPPDLRAMLQFALPISEFFPNWRTGWITKPIIEWKDRTPIVRGQKVVPIHDQVAWPAVGICFDIEHSNFWIDAWGRRPEDLDAALNMARKKFADAPKLIPLYSHRYVPGEPCESGNPVLSVYQTDLIHYGFDLASFFAREFGVFSPDWAATEPREIRFWSALIS